jgi:hypothetical protein
MRSGSLVYKTSMTLMALLFTFTSCGAPVAIEQQAKSTAQEEANNFTTISESVRNSMSNEPKVQNLIDVLESEGTTVQFDRVQESQTEDGSTVTAIMLSNSNSADMRFLSIVTKENKVIVATLNHLAKNMSEARGQTADVMSGRAMTFSAKKADGDKVQITGFKTGNSLSLISSKGMMSLVVSTPANSKSQIGALATKCQSEIENNAAAQLALASLATYVIYACAWGPFSIGPCLLALGAYGAGTALVYFTQNQLDRCRAGK